MDSTSLSIQSSAFVFVFCISLGQHLFKVPIFFCLRDYFTLCQSSKCSSLCVCVYPAGKRSGVWGLSGGAVRCSDWRTEPTQGPAAGSSKQRARTQAEGEGAWWHVPFDHLLMCFPNKIGKCQMDIKLGVFFLVHSNQKGKEESCSVGAGCKHVLFQNSAA